MLDGKTTIGLVATPAVSAGYSVTATLDWDTSGVKKGTHTIIAKADDTNQVAESNESNNTSARSPSRSKATRNGRTRSTSVV